MCLSGPGRKRPCLTAASNHRNDQKNPEVVAPRPQGKEPAWPPAAYLHPLTHPLSPQQLNQEPLSPSPNNPHRTTGPRELNKESRGAQGTGPNLPSGATATPTRRPTGSRLSPRSHLVALARSVLTASLQGMRHSCK